LAINPDAYRPRSDPNGPAREIGMAGLSGTRW
jgi:hypothetical protein